MTIYVYECGAGSNVELVTKQDLKLAKEEIMATIADFAAAVQTNYDTLTTGIQSLHDLITAFNNSPGTLSPADQSALDKIEAESAALATAVNSDVVVPPVPPAA
jgi:hypothetical protein